MADVCKFCGQEIAEESFCSCDGAVGERTAIAPQPEVLNTIETAVGATAENIAAPQPIADVFEGVNAVEATVPQAQTLPNIPPIAPVQAVPPQPIQQPIPPVQPQPTYYAQQPYGTPQQQPIQPGQQGYGYQQPNQGGYQQPNQGGYQPPQAGHQQPPTPFQMPSQITDAASAVSATFMDLIKNPLDAAKAGTINTTNSWVLLGLLVASYVFYLFFRGFRFFGFASLSGTANFIVPILTVTIAVALLFFALVLSCNFAKVPTVSSQSIFGLIAISSIPLTIGYLVNLVIALIFGNFGFGSLLITLIRLFSQIIFILILEHGMSDKIKNDTHRVLAVGISLAIFLGIISVMSGLMDTLMNIQGSYGMFWDMFN